MGYKTELQSNNTDLQALLDMILALGLRNKTLEECTWNEISSIASAGKAQNYFSIGDCKKITIDGIVGTLELSNYETYVYIIGFDHNGATNTIDFGTFKTAASGGIDVCLVDGNYNSYSTGGTSYFNMQHLDDLNTSGWKGCQLRYSVLGSSHGFNMDAIPDVVTNPRSGTLMAALPSELRAVMKPMTIYTDNVGRGTGEASNVTSSVDYLPLLAEFEIYGGNRMANSTERNYQKQYAYYSAGNSKVKYRHDAAGSIAYWWMRSPYYKNGTDFCYVGKGGGTTYGAASYSYGLAPIFRV